MLNTTDSFLIEENGWTVRIRPPQNPQTPKLMLAIHGWTGDENSMSVFTNRLSPEFCVFAPRGPILSPNTGYGWTGVIPGRFATFKEFVPMADQLLNQLRLWLEKVDIPSDLPLYLMGFSQGAAMSYVLSILHPDRIVKVAGLSGFIPAESSDYLKPDLLLAKSYFVAHGSKDDIVPVELARETVRTLKSAGGNVIYCEEEVGHKLSLPCFKSLEAFFR